MRFRSLAVLVGFSLTVLTLGQRTGSESVQSASFHEESRIRVVVEVVSVDAIVTDRKGQHVKDLQMADFEVYQDGELQRITNFSYVNAVPDSTSEEAEVTLKGSGDLGKVPVFSGLPQQRRDVLRSIALVVDDIGMSFENLVFVREALKQFVEEQISPSDLVAISLTGSRTGALAQFTTHKQLLNAAVDRIRWGPVHRARPFDRGAFDRQFSQTERGETVEERSRSVGTLQSLRYTLESMEGLPGRKSAILVSEGFRLGYDELEGVAGSTDYMVEALREVMHSAHQSGVVIYAVDPRGGESLGLHPHDDFSGVVRLSHEVYAEIQAESQRSPDVWAAIEQRRADGYLLRTMSIEDIKTLVDTQMFTKITRARLDQFYQTQQGLNYLPVATGGLYLKYNNDINANLERVLEDQQGYYLIGYAPDRESVRSQGSRRFPRIDVKVRREGMNVRCRASFMGKLDSDQETSEPTPEERMHQLMSSPFASGQIPLELTSLYEHEPGKGAFLSSWLHVGAKGLSFSDEEGGWKKAEVEVWVAVFGEKPQPEGEKRETFSVRVRGQSHDRVMNDGLVCKVRMPARKPGPYQLRFVVRDKGSGRVGSANRFVQVPDIGADRLALSGIVVRGSSPGAPSVETDDMALRKFRRGTILNYALYIYNAQINRATRTPQLETQVKLFRDGREIYTGQKQSFDLKGRFEDSMLIGNGSLELGSQLNTGHYAMEYTVTDKLANEGHETANQWIDFEILD